MDKSNSNQPSGLISKYFPHYPAKPIAVTTAYDYPFAKILDESGIDIVLVGDSLGMVVLGYDTTLPVTVSDMTYHTAAVARAVKNALVVADMPYRSYGTSAAAVKNAKLLKKFGAQAVKLEGGAVIQKQIAAILKAGIPVMGHLGMTPQSVEKLGGYKVQGKSKDAASLMLEQAIACEQESSGAAGRLQNTSVFNKRAWDYSCSCSRGRCFTSTGNGRFHQGSQQIISQDCGAQFAVRRKSA